MTLQKPPMVDESKLKSDIITCDDGLKWHYVEMGRGTPIVLIHGIPESWYCWRYQFEPLAEHFRVIAPDLKGYGQSDKRDGDYSILNVAKELVAFLDKLGLEKFHLAGHDWGAGVSLAIASLYPGRVLKYFHMSTPTWDYDETVAPHHNVYVKDQSLATEKMSDPKEYVKWWWETGGHPGGISALTEAEWDRMAKEMAHPGLAEAVPRYFRDSGTMVKEGGGPGFLLDKLTVDTCFIYPDSDPRQPLNYIRPSELKTRVPGFKRFEVVTESGHFTMQNQPQQVNDIMLDFLLND